jgi:hypothetical protein
MRLSIIRSREGGDGEGRLWESGLVKQIVGGE